MRWKRTLLALCLSAVCAAGAGRASALEYTVDAPEGPLFGRPTSVETVWKEAQPVNVDRSKNVSLIPPGFGTPTSYLPGSGEYLTPNLVPGAFNGGLVTATGAGTAAAGYVSANLSGSVPAVGAASGTSATAYPAVTGTGNGTASGTGTAVDPPSPGGSIITVTYEPSSPASGYSAAFTDVTRDLYYSGGHLATLKIPSIGVNVKVYEGTDTDALAKGAGHFSDTSIWDGNVSIAGHNRGTNCYFADIHTLDIGDKVTLTTKLGTRTYSVTSVKKVSVTDDSDTVATVENCVTLYTCVRNQSEYRWCVRAVEVS